MAAPGIRSLRCRAQDSQLSENYEISSTYAQTPYVDLVIRMDNGRTYFEGPFTLGGNCANNRLELNDGGDKFGSVENGRRMMALILAARTTGLKVSLGYDDTDISLLWRPGSI